MKTTEEPPNNPWGQCNHVALYDKPRILSQVQDVGEGKPRATFLQLGPTGGQRLGPLSRCLLEGSGLGVEATLRLLGLQLGHLGIMQKLQRERHLARDRVLEACGVGIRACPVTH